MFINIKSNQRLKMKHFISSSTEQSTEILDDSNKKPASNLTKLKLRPGNNKPKKPANKNTIDAFLRKNVNTDTETNNKKNIRNSGSEKESVIPGEVNNIKSRGLKSFNSYLSEDDKVVSVNEYNDTVPENVEGVYKYDFNLVDIHDVILKKFDHQKNYEIVTLEQMLLKEKEKSKEYQNMVDRKATLKNIERIEDRIKQIKNNSGFDHYINKISPLIEEYNLMGTLSKIVSFATKKDIPVEEPDELPETPEVQEKRHQIIYDFIEVARKYIDLDIIRENKVGNVCQTCHQKLEDIDMDETEDSGIIICPNCNTEKISVVRSRFYKDNDRTNNSGNNYEDRTNFLKVLMRYQGKQPDKPPSELYIKLEHYFSSNKLPKISIDGGEPVYVTSEYIRNMPLNSEDEKDGTNRSLMCMALRDIGCSGYYDHLNIILNEMWGWKLDDVTHLEDQIMNDYDESQRVYEIIPKDRKSSLNSQFRLYKHLRRLKHHCKSKNFRIPTTPDILEFHENLWSKICEMLSWENL